jgi:hypothetical protein
MRLLRSIKGMWVSEDGMLSVGERVIQPVVHKALPDTHHGVAGHLEGVGNLLIGPPGAWRLAINFEQDTSMGLLARRRLAFGDQFL